MNLIGLSKQVTTALLQHRSGILTTDHIHDRFLTTLTKREPTYTLTYNGVRFVTSLTPWTPPMANITTALKLRDIARRIARQEAQLATLRRRLDSRLTILNRRREELRDELRNVETELLAIGPSDQVLE